MELAERMVRQVCVPLLSVLSGFALACVAGCNRDSGLELVDSPRAVERVIVVGSSTMAPLLSEIGKAYEKTHPESRI